MKASAVAVLISLIATSGAIAEGALAIGSTGNVSQDGISYGIARNYSSREAAEQAALQSCRDFAEQNAKETQRFCRVFARFRRECYAIANDPEPGTPGTGWAVAASEDVAKERAMGACESSAGPGREGQCVISEANCDEND